MEFTQLTLDQQKAILEDHIRKYEALWYSQHVEVVTAERMGMRDVAETAAKKRDQFEDALEIVKAELALLA